MQEKSLPEEYKPISMWGYFGYEILFSIPVLGFIILIIKALTAKNKNLRNFARSYFCLTILCAILCLISAITYVLLDSPSTGSRIF